MSSRPVKEKSGGHPNETDSGRSRKSGATPSTENQSTERAPLGPNNNPPSKPRTKRSLPPEGFQATPQRSSKESPLKCKAVAIDCEMVGSVNGYSQLAYLSAVDVLTGEVLIDSYVQPTDPVTSWRTPVSGITADKMWQTVRTGTVLPGWQAARGELWRYVDDQTVLVGHSLENDLKVLGMIHHKIVDSAILTAEAVFPTIKPNEELPHSWALKTLAKELRGQDIQMPNMAHSALQDAYATRDLVIFCIQAPQALKDWAIATRKVEQERKEELERKLKALKKKREEDKKAQVEADTSCGGLLRSPGIVHH